MPDPILLSQNDPQWKDIKVGTGEQTIGQIGCTITCIGMKYGITPDKVNELLNAVTPDKNGNTGYADENLVYWTRIGEGIQGAVFGFKYQAYDNDIVLNNLPCIVEVDAAPIGGIRHWVLFIGNHQIYDPWDGKIKSTGVYKPLSFVTLSGTYVPKSNDKPQTPPSNPDPDNCLVPNTPQWRETYAKLVKGSSEYDKFVAAGYVSFTDVTLKIEGLEKQISDLQKKSGTTTVSAEKVESLKSDLPHVMSAASLIQDWGKKWLDDLTAATTPQPRKKSKVNVSDTKPVETASSYLLKLFHLDKKGGEVIKK